MGFLDGAVHRYQGYDSLTPLYASPDLCDLTSCNGSLRLEGFLMKLQPLRVLREVIDTGSPVQRRLFPPIAQLLYFLLPTLHPFQLPLQDDWNFISRALFKPRANSSVSRKFDHSFPFFMYNVTSCYNAIRRNFNDYIHSASKRAPFEYVHVFLCACQYNKLCSSSSLKQFNHNLTTCDW